MSGKIETDTVQSINVFVDRGREVTPETVGGFSLKRRIARENILNFYGLENKMLLNVSRQLFSSTVKGKKKRSQKPLLHLL